MAIGCTWSTGSRQQAESGRLLQRRAACWSGAHKNCISSQQYNPQQVKAGFQSFPQPTAAQLATLTAQVAINGHFSATESNSDATVMAAVRSGIQHVIYILKENRATTRFWEIWKSAMATQV